MFVRGGNSRTHKRPCDQRTAMNTLQSQEGVSRLSLDPANKTSIAERYGGVKGFGCTPDTEITHVPLTGTCRLSTWAIWGSRLVPMTLPQLRA